MRSNTKREQVSNVGSEDVGKEKRDPVKGCPGCGFQMTIGDWEWCPICGTMKGEFEDL